jgi:hypothetical protein
MNQTLGRPQTSRRQSRVSATKSSLVERKVPPKRQTSAKMLIKVVMPALKSFFLAPSVVILLVLLTSVGAQSSQERLVLSFDGLGSIQLGMSVSRLRPDIKLGSADTGIHTEDIPGQLQGCVDVTFLENSSSFGLQIQHGRIYRVDIIGDSNVETNEGIRLGSTEDDIRHAYGGLAYRGRLIGGNSTIYGVNTQTGRAAGRDGQGHAFLVRSKDGKRAIVMETDGVQVIDMHAGYIKAFPRDRDDGSIKVISCTDLQA